MSNVNRIDCDVCSCKHNEDGRNCRLSNVKITCDCSDCTCCGSFCQKNCEE